MKRNASRGGIFPPTASRCGMSYRSILVHADNTRNVRERIRIAAQIAIREDALLVGAAITGESAFIEQAALVNGYDPDITNHLAAQIQALRKSASDALFEFERIARELNVQRRETHAVDEACGDGFAMLARSNDLVVIGQNDPDDAAVAMLRHLPESVASTTGRPVLIVPYAGQFREAVGRVLIGWDASPCATRAMTFALPLLRRAEAVDVVVFNPDTRDGPAGTQTGDEAVRYLAHHDIQARLERQNVDIDLGNALLSLAADFSSDLLVMGAYGHTRLREILFGGATRSVLQSATVPVLMSH
jgi:nucleotide-binding universal stress UspA family protein